MRGARTCAAVLRRDRDLNRLSVCPGADERVEDRLHDCGVEVIGIPNSVDARDDVLRQRGCREDEGALIMNVSNLRRFFHAAAGLDVDRVGIMNTNCRDG